MSSDFENVIEKNADKVHHIPKVSLQYLEYLPRNKHLRSDGRTESHKDGCSRFPVSSHAAFV